MNNILFFGTYQHKVDSKGRVSIPAEWRKRLFILIDRKALFTLYNKEILCCYNTFRNIKSSDIIAYKLDAEGRVIFKEQKNKIAVLKGCGDYFTIEFNAKK